MQCISLDYLWKLITGGVFMPSMAECTLKLSRTTAILLVFQADDQHEKIPDVYIVLIVSCIESHLYAPEQILDLMSNIEVNLKVVHDAFKAGGDPGKRCAFCLFVNNYGGVMSIPMDSPYCLIYPMSYMKDVEPDYFNTCNNPAKTCLHCCICCATLQYMDDDPRYYRAYDGSHLILPNRATYKERLFPENLEPRNHQAPLTDSITKEPFPMELVGDFRSTDPIFRGCYGDSFLYSDVDLGQLRQREIHLPLYWGEILVPLAPSYLQAKQSKATKWSPPWAAMPNTAVESPKTKHSSGKGGHHRSSEHSSNTSTPKHPSSSKEPVLKEQDKSPRSHSSHKCGHSPSPSVESDGHKQKEAHTEDTCELNSTLPISSSGFDGFRTLMGPHSEATKLHPPSITSTPLGLGAPKQ